MAVNSLGFICPDGYTVNCGIFTFIDGEINIILKQDIQNNEIKYHLPEEFVQPNENGLLTMKRMLKDKIHFKTKSIRHLGIFDNPNRDTRGWILSNLFYVIIPPLALEDILEIIDNENLILFPISQVENIEFLYDNQEMTKKMIETVKNETFLGIPEDKYINIRRFLNKEFTSNEIYTLLKRCGYKRTYSTFLTNLKNYQEINESERTVCIGMKNKKTRLFTFSK